MSHGQHSLILRYLRRVHSAANSGDVTDADLLARFLATRDEAAFELLLWRHGTMVLQVCRDITRDEHTAEDAFQATFLTLVRQGRSIRSREALGAWLHRVAWRAALRARRANPQPATSDLSVVPAVQELPEAEALRELRPILQEEVQRLPARYRAPIVLCYLEGLTHEEAARQLGWPKGTVAGRMARARELLRKRLTRRGVGLSVALSALVLAPGSASAVVPAGLVQATLHVGLLAAAGQSAAAVSPQVLALSEGVIQTMFWQKMKIVMAAMLVLGLAGGVGLLASSRPGAAEQAVAQDEEDQPKPTRPTTKKIQREEQTPRAAGSAAAARRQSLNNLKQIAIAMHNYQDTHGCFPPAAIYGKNGKPLLSWRVLLLPYLEQDNLYRQFHLDEPWDSPHNKKLLETKVKAYHIPGHDDWTKTYYQVFVGEDTVFERRREVGVGGGAGGAPAGSGGGAGIGPGAAGPGGATGGAALGGGPAGGIAGGIQRGMGIADITDGTSNTILVIEGATPVPWTKPEDLPYAPTGKLPELGAFKDAIHAAFADGSVHTIKRRFDETAMRAAITRNGGEVYDRDDLFDPSPGADAPALREINADLRDQITKARADMERLQQQHQDQWLRSKGGESETEVDRLKREQRMLRQELERLQQAIERMRNETQGVKPTAKPTGATKR
jgi:RNA polymerase sigma factor (sigma-70 family)